MSSPNRYSEAAYALFRLGLYALGEFKGTLRGGLVCNGCGMGGKDAKVAEP